jgi:cell division protease FtsH
MNEAAILAARENRKKITQYDLIRSIEKVMLGPERKSHLLNKREKEGLRLQLSERFNHTSLAKKRRVSKVEVLSFDDLPRDEYRSLQRVEELDRE